MGIFNLFNKKKRNPDNAENYPNGARRQPMDERLPTGETVNEALGAVKPQGRNPFSQVQVEQPMTERARFGNQKPVSEFGNPLQYAVTPPSVMPEQDTTQAIQNGNLQPQTVNNPQDPTNMAVRPRMVPNAPVTTDANIAPQVPPMPNTAVNPATLNRQQKEQALNDLSNKDYSIKKDAQGNVISRGKDRDTDHNWWDVLKSVGLGAFAGLNKGGLLGALAGAVTGGVRGVVDRNADEKMLDSMFRKPKAAMELAQAQQQEEFDTQQQANQARIEGIKTQTAAIPAKLEQADKRLSQKDTEIELRRSRQDFQKVNAEQKLALSAIMRRGVYKEGLNPDEDKRLADLGIVLPDFDARKRQVKEQAGKVYQLNPDTQTWEESQGIGVDESEVPIDFMVGGKKMKLRPRDIATIEASKERQNDQQDFTSREAEKKRAFDLKKQEIGQQMKLQLENLRTANALLKSATTAEQKAKAEEQKRAADAEYLRLYNENKALQP